MIRTARKGYADRVVRYVRQGGFHGLMTYVTSRTAYFWLHAYAAIKRFCGGEMDANGSYPFTLLDNGQVVSPVIPDLHSGLGVLWAQSVLGAGRDVALPVMARQPVFSPEMIAAGWAYVPQEITVVRAPNGAYWIVQINATVGCRLAKLSDPSDLEISIRAGQYTGAEGTIKQASVLGQLYAVGATVEVVTPQALVDRLGEDEDYWNSTRWGWQWTTQAQGEDDEYEAKAIITLHSYLVPEGMDQAQTLAVPRTLRLSLNWDDDAQPLPATITQEDGDPAAINSVLVDFRYRRYPTRNRSATRRAGVPLWTNDDAYINPRDGRLAQSCVIASWYGANGEENRVVWNGSTENAAHSIPYNYPQTMSREGGSVSITSTASAGSATGSLTVETTEGSETYYCSAPTTEVSQAYGLTVTPNNVLLRIYEPDCLTGEEEFFDATTESTVDRLVFWGAGTEIYVVFDTPGSVIIHSQPLSTTRSNPYTESVIGSTVIKSRCVPPNGEPPNEWEYAVEFFGYTDGPPYVVPLFTNTDEPIGPHSQDIIPRNNFLRRESVSLDHTNNYFNELHPPIITSAGGEFIYGYLPDDPQLPPDIPASVLDADARVRWVGGA